MNKKIFYISALIAIIFLLATLSGILKSFVIGLIIAYIFDPAIDYLETKKIRRELGIALVFTLVIGIIILLISFTYPLMSKEIKIFTKKLPAYTEKLRKTTVPIVKEYIDKHPEQLELLKEKAQTAGLSLVLPVINFFKNIFSGTVNIIVGILDLLIIPVMAFYLLKDIDKLKEKIIIAIPKRFEEKILDIGGEIDTTLKDFIKGQLTVSFLLAILYSIGLSIFGVPIALVIGIVAGFANIIPYLGIAIGLLPAVLLSYLDSQSFVNVIGVVATFSIAQLLEGTLISPKIVGDKVGLHPVTVIIAIILGGNFFGFVGILAAVPVASVLNVLVKRTFNWYLQSSYYLD